MLRGVGGCGFDTISSQLKNEPFAELGQSVQRERMASIDSSIRVPRRANDTSTASISSSSQPTPTPRMARPLLSRSSVDHSFATYAGWRCGRIKIPVASRSRVEIAATNESQTIGSHSTTSLRPGISPVSLYGYGDFSCIGVSTCSTAQTDSTPDSSHTSTALRMSSGVFQMVLANIRPS